MKSNAPSNFPPPATPVPPEFGKRPLRLPFRYHDSLLLVNLVISRFVGLSAMRSFEGRDSVDAENLAGFQ